jgi:Cu/Ag efflux protein CusF
VLSKFDTRIVVDEDEIPGVMRAMVMSYEVENPDQLKGLKEGDKVKLKLKETEDKLTVVDLKKR